MTRRSLSGIYIFHKFEEDDRREPTCFEDCPEETQDEWLNTLSEDSLRDLSKKLGRCLRELGDEFKLEKM